MDKILADAPVVLNLIEQIPGAASGETYYTTKSG
jgi:hypothetical protein